MYPSLVKLRSFIAVADCGRFHKASEQLGISQPTLSLHVRDLERQLKVPLIHRTTRSLRVTAEGQMLLARAKRIMAELSAAVLEVKEQVKLERGRVVIASVPTLASDPLPRILIAYKERFPGITISLLEEDASAVAQRVEAGLADFGLMARPDRRTGLAFQPLARDPFVALFRKGQGPEPGKAITLRNLLSGSFLTVTQGSSIRALLEKAAIREGLTFEPVHELAQHTTLVSMVKAGVGAAALPAMSLKAMDLSGADVVPLVRPSIARELGIVHRKGEKFSAAATELAGAIRRNFLLSGRDDKSNAIKPPAPNAIGALKSKR